MKNHKVVIYYDNKEKVDEPLSKLMEELRTEISNVRGKLSDIKRNRGWPDRIDYIEGGLTCLLVAMNKTLKEWREFEEKNASYE